MSTTRLVYNKILMVSIIIEHVINSRPTTHFSDNKRKVLLIRNVKSMEII